MSTAVTGEVQRLPGAWMEEARDELGAWCARKGNSQAGAARGIGVSASQISQFLAGSYRGDVAGLATKVMDFLGVQGDRQAAQELPDVAEWAETTVARRVWKLLRACHVDCGFGMVVGDAGLGKTRTLERYVEQHPTAIRLRANTAARSPHYFLQQLGTALRIQVPRSNLLQAITAVTEALAGTDRLLAIDEAQHLSDRALEVVRDVLDEAGCGIVLVGNGRVLQAIHGGGVAAFAQQFSRVDYLLNLDAAMLTRQDLDCLFGGGHSEASADLLLQWMRSRGSVRQAVKTYRLAVRLAAGATDKPFEDLLTMAHRMRQVTGEAAR